jgi:glycosyltransferase involved in cell wall biosynthesis/SAM-dependent methyltransferase
MLRVACWTPLPPARSGIADYSEALLEAMRPLAEVTPVTAEGPRPECDVALYQVGNNAFHAFVYREAIARPGVVVLHEANLHHLVAEMTIRRGDWDAYLRECEYDGGRQALDFARRVRALETGPDYDGVPMLRRLLESARGLVVHSRYVESLARGAGYNGPVGVIPHGAWIPDADRLGYRHKLGLDENTPLIGVFGFLKPYKRIAESLRAFRRLLAVEPRAKMILAGEPHPEAHLESLIGSLGLSAAVRSLGFAAPADFTGYMAACDVVLNLRYPTVGETSGTLLRSLGLGRAVVVTDVGAFREYPDDICLKAPVHDGEEETIFEYLNLLVSRPELARAMGARARAWVGRECAWEVVARKYVAFLEAVASGREWTGAAAGPPPAQTAPPPVEERDLRVWSAPDAAAYIDTHRDRLLRTLEITPPGGPSDRILEMGAYLQITPSLKTKLGYEEVRGCYYGGAGGVDHRVVTSAEGERFECAIDLFDAERDRFPYPDGHFTTVLCCELIEHLADDPMHMMSEINRVVKPDGWLVLTTPNIGSLRAISAILQGFHPGFFPAYIRPREPGAEAEARHNREYTPKEVFRLFADAGFTVTLLETGPFRDEPKPEHNWVLHLLERYRLPIDLRGDGIYAVGRKTGIVRCRWPEWLYS